MFFIRAPSFSLRYRGNGKIRDVHLFMKHLYRYWYYKGFWGSCLASGVDFMNSIVVFVAVLFLTTMLDWTIVRTCDETTCVNATLIHSMHSPTVLDQDHMILALILLFSSFASVCYEFIGIVETCRIENEFQSMLGTIVDCGHPTPVHRWLHALRRMRAYSDGHEEICLTGDRPFIGNVSWGSFLDTLCEQIQRDQSFGMVSNKEFDSLRAVQALMMYDNFIITLYEHGVLERCSLKYADDELLKLIVSGVFDEFNTLDTKNDRVPHVRWQLFKYLVFYVLMYPFVLSLSVTKVLVKNAAQMRSGLDDYAARDWSNRARWTFRLYNEVPHILSVRLASGRKTAVGMVRRLQPYSSFSRFVRRTCSAVVCITVGLSFLNRSLLIGGTIGGISFVWWLSIALLVFSMCSEPEHAQREYNYLGDLKKLKSQVHYDQCEWNSSGDVFYDTLTHDFLKSRFYLIIGDLARTIFMPFILLAILMDKSIPELVNCICRESVRVDGMGSIAKGSAFDMQIVENNASNENTEDISLYAAFDKKCAMSVASFSSIYGIWAEKRMRAVDETAGSSPEATSRGQEALGHLLAVIQHRVNEEAPSLTSPTFLSSAVMETSAANLNSASQWVHVTAHEREQFFVSQVMNSSDLTRADREMWPVNSALGREGECRAVHSVSFLDQHTTTGDK